jgi:hypothetical protein
VTTRLVGFYALSRLVTAVAAVVGGLVSGVGFTQFLSTWDGGWYLKLVADGYPAGVPEVAGKATESTIGFFPLYPLTVRAVSWLLPVPDVMAAIAVSVVFGGVAVALFYRLATLFTDRRTAERAAILFAFFPGSFVLSMAYTEALMLALAAGCFLALFQRRWVLAGVLAALAAASRPSALALTAACAWQAALAIRQRREWRSIAAPLLAPAGVLAFFVYLKLRTGEFTAWFRVEREGWGQGPKLGWSAFQPVLDFLQSPFTDRRAAVVGVGLIFALVALGLLLWQRWPGALTIYTVAILAMSANARLDSVRPRTLLTAFPLIFATAKVAQGRWFTWLVGLSAVLLFVLAFGYNTLRLDQI